MISYALCAVAESEIHDGDSGRALRTIQRVRKLFVSEPNTISPSLIRDTGEMLAELERRIVHVETAIGSPPA